MKTLRPYATKFLKNYQFDRLNPNTHHQKAAATAIALGGFTGRMANSQFTGGGWLPAALYRFSLSCFWRRIWIFWTTFNVSALLCINLF